MNNYEATEIAYKNGYEAGKKDALKWIPVSERLPEEKGFYLTARKRDVFVEQWNGVWFSERCHHAQPTHWMPLPEPPKGE